MVDNSKFSPVGLEAFFGSLGLSDREVKIYLKLNQHGEQTVLELSKKTGIPRTQAYRLLDNLLSQKIVEEIVDEKRKLYRAIHPDQLERLIKNRKAQIEELATVFPEIQAYLVQQINRRQPDTKVLFYRGKPGIQHMVWNVLRAKPEFVGYTYRSLDDIVGPAFALDFYEEMVRSGKTCRDLFSDLYLEGYGQAKKHFTTSIPDWGKISQSRYLPPETLNITVQSDIYNEVISFYTWREREIFGVEIYNEKVAAMQKQVFEILWNLATPEGKLVNTP